MTTPQMKYDRITFSLPHHLNEALDALKNESHQSKSELIKTAIENYLEEKKRRKLQEAVVLMADAYENDDDLTAMQVLDSEAFQ